MRQNFSTYFKVFLFWHLSESEMSDTDQMVIWNKQPETATSDRIRLIHPKTAKVGPINQFLLKET